MCQLELQEQALRIDEGVKACFAGFESLARHLDRLLCLQHQRLAIQLHLAFGISEMVQRHRERGFKPVLSVGPLGRNRGLVQPRRASRGAMFAIPQRQTDRDRRHHSILPAVDHACIQRVVRVHIVHTQPNVRIGAPLSQPHTRLGLPEQVIDALKIRTVLSHPFHRLRVSERRLHGRDGCGDRQWLLRGTIQGGIQAGRDRHPHGFQCTQAVIQLPEFHLGLDHRTVRGGPGLEAGAGHTFHILDQTHMLTRHLNSAPEIPLLVVR